MTKPKHLSVVAIKPLTKSTDLTLTHDERAIVLAHRTLGPEIAMYVSTFVETVAAREAEGRRQLRDQSPKLVNAR